MFSMDGKGVKNGAHSIMSAKGVLSGQFNKIGHVEDNCTNIHYKEDLKLAERRLKINKKKH